MPSNFPTGPDNIQNNVANSTLEVDLHPSLHNKLADAVNAVETALLAGGTMNLAAHVAAADPHAVYLTQTEGDARYTTIAGGIPDGSITSAKIADATIVAGDLADGAVTSAKIADGTIATADLANASVTNAKLASDTARANLLTNGGFEVWQRGNGPFTTNGAWTADRWNLGVSGSTVSVSRVTAGEVETGSGSYAMGVQYIHVGGGYAIFDQKIENYTSLQGKTITASVRVYGTFPTNSVSIRLLGTGLDITTTNTATGAQTLTVSGVVPSAVGSITLRLACINASSTTYFDNAMLVVGSVAADYAPLHPADDLARCLRYYELVGESNGSLQVGGYATATAQYAFYSPRFMARKTVVPTVTKIGNWYVNNASQPTASGVGPDCFIYQTSSVASGFFYTNNGNAGDKFTVEANP